MQRKLLRILALLVCLTMLLGSLALADDENEVVAGNEAAEIVEADTSEALEEGSKEVSEVTFTNAPEDVSTADSTEAPEEEPTAAPTEVPEEESTVEPTEVPEGDPTAKPTEVPEEEPTADPTEVPEEEPTADPTEAPDGEPTEEQISELSNDVAAVYVDPDMKEICDQQGHLYTTDYFYTQAVSSNAQQHAFYCQKITQCERCYEVKEIETLPDPVYENHIFDGYVNGRCEVCNYACPHENVQAKEENVVYGWHRVSYETGHCKYKMWDEVYECETCKSKFGYASTPMLEYVGDLEPHVDDDEDGYCDVCDTDMTYYEYETADGKPAVQNCDHKGYTYEEVTYRKYKDGGDKCIAMGKTVDVYLVSGGCKTCGLKCNDSFDDGSPLATYEYPDAVERIDHDFRTVGEYTGGICNYCGHVVDNCSHSRLYCTGKHFDNLIPGQKFEDAGDGTHRGQAYFNVESRCYDCGILIVKVVQEEASEPHDFSGSDPSVCVVCGAKCDHAQAAVVESWVEVSGDAEVVDQDAKEHEIKDASAQTIVRYECPQCGWRWKEPGPGPQGAFKQPHEWLGGVCSVCGYENNCAHPSTREEITRTDDLPALDLGDSGHMFRRESYVKTYCAVCGELLEGFNYEEDGENFGEMIEEEINEPHRYVNGVCSVCGHVKPAATAAPAADANSNQADDSNAASSDEPKLTEVPASEAAPNVAVEDDLRMGTALVEVADGVKERYGASASVEIQGAKAVLTADESAKFEALSSSERVLVILRMLGQDDEANNALSEVGINLSPEAQALMADIVARLSAMTPEEYAQLEALFSQYFPVKLENGVNVMQITLEIRAGTETWIERYSFAQDAEGWKLVKIETGTPAAAA